MPSHLISVRCMVYACVASGSSCVSACQASGVNAIRPSCCQKCTRPTEHEKRRHGFIGKDERSARFGQPCDAV